MARPQNEGLNYFPLDVDIDQDDKIRLVESQHGMIGFAIVVRLFMKIYKEGYFYEWGEKEQLLFSMGVNVDVNDVNAVINSCLRWNVFNAKLFERFNILTSAGIQRRYLEATSRRQQVEVVKEYLLIDAPNRRNIVMVDINGVNVDSESNSVTSDVGINSNSNNVNEVNVIIDTHSHEVNNDIGTQSKVKESKVKNINITSPPDEGDSTPSKNATPYKEIVDTYNIICKSLPRVQVVSDKRKDKMRVTFRRIGEKLSDFQEVFRKAEDSDFLSGRSGAWTGASFDWLINYNNFIKVLEGNYDNRESVMSGSSSGDGRYIPDSEASQRYLDWIREGCENNDHD